MKCPVQEAIYQIILELKIRRVFQEVHFVNTNYGVITQTFFRNQIFTAALIDQMYYLEEEKRYYLRKIVPQKILPEKYAYNLLLLCDK